MKPNIIPNLAKSCEVLRQIGAAEDGLTQAQVERQVVVPRATAFRILTTLHSEGFVQKEGSRYLIGKALAQLGIKALSAASIRDVARPVLAELARNSGETAHVTVPSGNHVLILEVCDSPNPVHAASRAGTLADMHCSSTGKVFLAYLSGGDEMVDQLHLTQHTDGTITDPAALREELETVRELGYALDDEEFWLGVRCLGAPVRDGSGQIVAGIGITGTASRFTPEHNQTIADIVLAAAAALEARLHAQ